MKHRSGALFALAALVLLPGCWVYSAHPLAETDDDITFDRALLGHWVQTDAGCTLRVSRFAEERFYRVEYSAPPEKHGDGCLLDTGHSATFEARLVEIGDNRFLDVLPADRTSMHHQMSLHSFYRVKVDTTRLTLTPLNHEWTRSQILQERFSLAGRQLEEENEAIVLTSTTKQLREFLRGYGNSVEAFTPEARLSFQRRPDASR